MTRAALLLLALLASPAAAGERHEWGKGPSGPCALILARCDGEDCWTVTFRNTLIASVTFFEVTLDLPGMAVVVSYRGADGELPDTFAVSAPAGWVAEPGELVVPDGGSGVIVIRPLPMG